MSRVRFVRGTVLGTGLAASVGDEHELDAGDAQWFVSQGRAHFVDAAETLDPDPGRITVKDTPAAKASRTR